jgi:predicted AAA+ superfamily ATPase
MDFDTLLLKNPWWKGKEFLSEDEDFRKWLEKKVRWEPEIVKDISLKPFSLHFILGPRQSGKSTAIKLIIRNLLEKNNPKSIFYFRCDDIADYKELRELIESYLELREKWGISNSFIFLDEISSPKEWFRTIKAMIDDGVFRNDVLILSSSTSIKIKKETEFFPGRRGNGKDFYILPLNFREFIKVFQPELFKKLPSPISEFSFEEIRKKSLEAIAFLGDLNKLFSIYLEVGGFPLAINSYFEKRYVENSVKETYLSWFKNDIVKAGRSVENAREIVKCLLAKIPSAISWESIAKETSIKSPKTVNAYLHIFSEMFSLIISYFIDPNSLVLQFGKNKKIHLIDPLLFSIFEDWCAIKIKEKESVVAESILASHLFRRFGEVFYWKNNTEIDCVVRRRERLVGFECKWKERIERKKIFVGKIKEVYTLSKKEFDVENKIIPLALFLSLL